MIEIYADGSALGNPGGIGGWGAVILAYGTVIRTVSGGELSTTNNRMELLGVIGALRVCPKSSEGITVYSDSQYIVSTVNKGWARNKNTDMWDELQFYLDMMKVEFVWVKGHNGNTYNEVANELATSASAKMKEYVTQNKKDRRAEKRERRRRRLEASLKITGLPSEQRSNSLEVSVP